MQDKFEKVYDGRKQPVRGLWARNGRYYAQLKLPDTTGLCRMRRVSLKNPDETLPSTDAQAIAALRRLQTQRADESLPVVTQTPKLQEYANAHIARLKAESATGARAKSSAAKAETSLGNWIESMGADVRLDVIKPAHVLKYRDERTALGRNPKTINADVIHLRVMLKRAKAEGYIKTLPTEDIAPLKTVAHQRKLYAASDIDALLEIAARELTDGVQFCDYVNFLRYTGARRCEALAVKWSDIDLTRAQVTIRGQWTANGFEPNKGRAVRVVDCSHALLALLREMNARKAPDSVWLFPSPQRGETDVPATSLWASLNVARQAAKMPEFGFHDLRHYFISTCVMAGIDFMTIAAWVGHKDGGVLIGRVYGHLANEHKSAMAAKLNFGNGNGGAQ